MTAYRKLTGKDSKIQVDSAVRDANGVRIDTNYARIDDLEDKVDKNPVITAGTHTKITYDAKGLVTAGTDLAASDIPDIAISQVTGLQDELDDKVDDSQLVASWSATVSDTNIPSEKLVKDSLDGKAPESHADATAKFGAGTASLYGHVKVDNAISDVSENPVQNKIIKEYVDDQVSTNTANYISDNGQPFASPANLPTDPAVVSNNDYAFVTGIDAAGNTFYDRYKATVSNNTVTWAKEYRLNNSSFTTAQWDTINSLVRNSGNTGIDVQTIINHIADGTIHVTQTDKDNWNNKVDKLTTSPAGTYPKVTVNAQGQVTSGTTLVESDIPQLPISKITDLQTELDDKLDDDQLVTSFQQTPDDTHIPSEKLVKDSLDDKLDDSQLVTAWSSTTSNDNIPSEKLTKDSLDAKLDDSQLVTSWSGTVSDSNIPSEKLTKDSLDAKLDGSQLVTAWQSTVSDSNIPSEKLTKDSIDTVQTNLNTHTARTDNPHSVTQTQVGLSDVVNQGMDSSPISGSIKYVTSGGVFTAIKTVQDDIDAHELRTDNPHSVTKSQVGLGNVDNKASVSVWQTAPDDDHIPTEKLVKDSLDDKVDDSQVVTSWSSTTSNDNIPSEKLTKDSLDAKLDDTQLVTAFQQTPDDNHIPSEKLVKDSLDEKVDGPASAVSDNVVLFDGTTGKIIKDSGKTLGASIPAPTVADKDKALIVNATGNGFTFGEAGKVDDVQINGSTSIVINKVAKIPITVTDVQITEVD